MKIIVVEVSIYIPGCTSLKEKRRRTASLRDRYGSMKQVAVCECGKQDSHKNADWCFVVVGNDDANLDRTVSHLEQDLMERYDFEVLSMRKSVL